MNFLFLLPALLAPSLWCMNFVPNQKNVSFGNNIEIDRTTTFTLSGWIYISDPGSVHPTVTVAAKFQDPTPKGYDLEVIDQTLFWHQIQAYGTKELRVQTGASTIPSNQWLHVAATGDGTGTYAGLKLYINGVNQSTTNLYDTLDGSSATIQPFYIGFTQNEAEGMTGTIVGVGVYNRNLSTGEMQEIYNAGKGGNLKALSSVASLTNYWRLGVGDSVVANGVIDLAGSINGSTIGMVAADIGACRY